MHDKYLKKKKGPLETSLLDSNLSILPMRISTNSRTLHILNVRKKKKFFLLSELPLDSKRAKSVYRLQNILHTFFLMLLLFVINTYASYSKSNRIKKNVK